MFLEPISYGLPLEAGREGLISVPNDDVPDFDAPWKASVSVSSGVGVGWGGSGWSGGSEGRGNRDCCLKKIALKIVCVPPHPIHNLF